MSSPESSQRQKLDERLRRMISTVIDPIDLLSRSSASAGSECTDLIIQRVIDEIGEDAGDWQSHEYVEPIREACIEAGLRDWADEFEKLVCYSGDQLVPGMFLAELTKHLTDFSHPRQLESFFSRSFLSQNWPLHDGLKPVEPFRLMHRYVEVGSILSSRDHVETICEELFRELEWVSGDLIVAGALDGPLEISQEEATLRWIRLSERVRGFQDSLRPRPRVRWECSAPTQPNPGFLYADSGKEAWLGDLLVSCASRQGAVDLILRLPEEVPVALRPILSKALRGVNPPELISDSNRQAAIIAGVLPADPEVIRVIEQRTHSFDLILELGADPPWRKDWLDLRAAGSPLWWAREQDFPQRSIDYIHIA